MSAATDEERATQLKNKENFLRQKDRELKKREEIHRERVANLESARTRAETLLQELDAREIVMDEAEAKHGTLLRREDNVTRREQDAEDKHQRLLELSRQLEAQKRELDSKKTALEEEYESRFLPLTAMEQEAQRREQEVEMYQEEIEAKVKAMQRKQQLDEDRERQREKYYRDQEAKTKDSLLRLERREREAEKQHQQMQDRQRALKADQVELESRDRDLKWRADQLRTALGDTHTAKKKLTKWQQDVDLRNEAQEVMQAELDKRQYDLEVTKVTLEERTALLLDGERTVSETEAKVAADQEQLQRDLADGERRLKEIEDLRRRLDADTVSIRSRERSLREQLAVVLDKEHEVELRVQAVRRREQAVKRWTAALEWREQQCSRREAAGAISNTTFAGPPGMSGTFGGAMKSGSGGTSPPPFNTSTSTRQTFAAPHGQTRDASAIQDGPRQKLLGRGIVSSQVARAQETYLQPVTAVANRSPAAAVESAAAQNAPSRTNPGLPEPATEAQLRQEEDEMRRAVAKLGKEFHELCTRIFSAPPRVRGKAFSPEDFVIVKEAYEVEFSAREESLFLTQIFGLSAATNDADLAALNISSRGVAGRTRSPPPPPGVQPGAHLYPSHLRAIAGNSSADASPAPAPADDDLRRQSTADLGRSLKGKMTPATRAGRPGAGSLPESPTEESAIGPVAHSRLRETLMSRGSGGATPMWFSTTAQWHEWFSTSRNLARSRYRTVLAARMTHLTHHVEMLQEQLGLHEHLFPSDYEVILRDDQAVREAVMSARAENGGDRGRGSSNRDRSPEVANNAPAKGGKSGSESKEDEKETNDEFGKAKKDRIKSNEEKRSRGSSPSTPPSSIAASTPLSSRRSSPSSSASRRSTPRSTPADAPPVDPHSNGGSPDGHDRDHDASPTSPDGGYTSEDYSPFSKDGGGGGGDHDQDGAPDDDKGGSERSLSTPASAAGGDGYLIGEDPTIGLRKDQEDERERRRLELSDSDADSPDRSPDSDSEFTLAKPEPTDNKTGDGEAGQGHHDDDDQSEAESAKERAAFSRSVRALSTSGKEPPKKQRPARDPATQEAIDLLPEDLKHHYDK